MIKEWGFVQRVRGSVNNLERAAILIGYPFAFGQYIPPPVPIVIPFLDPSILYYRAYTHQAGPRPIIPYTPLTSSTILDANLAYFKAYLGK